MVVNGGFLIPDQLQLAMTSDSKHAIQYASHEAFRLDQAICTTAHLLLGLVRLGRGAAFEMYRTTESWGNSNVEVRQLVQDIFGSAKPADRHPDRWTNTAIDVMTRACEIVPCGQITPDELYQSLLQEDECFASVIIDKFSDR